MKRTLNIETTKHLGEKVMVCGWAQTIRSHGKIIFIDLRDRTGILQLVVTPENSSLYKIFQKVRPEWVIGVEGIIEKRPKGQVNPKLQPVRLSFIL